MKYQIYSSQEREQRLRQGLLGAFIDELANVLLERGYPKSYLGTRFAVIEELNRWLIRRKTKLCNLDQLRIDQFIRHRSKQRSMSKRGETVTLDLLLWVLRTHGEIPPLEAKEVSESEIERILDQYNHYLVDEQGLSLGTVSKYLSDIRRFLSDLFRSKPIDFDSVCAQNITTFVREYAQGHGWAVSALMVSSLRSFLRFLLLRGEISVDLASCVPTVPNRKHNSVPQYLSPQELDHLLKCSKGESPLEIRNYAILLLLSRLGLRASEVVALTLDDIDWEHGEFVIRGKGARRTPFPLPVEVGETLVRYLKYSRPLCSSRSFFICSRVPVGPFKGSSTVSMIVQRCIERAGLNPPKKGAHLLRHTLATVSLSRGASLSEVGEILRHRQIDTTAIYAKVDFARLVTIAQPWPDSSFSGGGA